MVSFDDVLPTLLGACEGGAFPDIGACQRCCVVRDLEGRVRLVVDPKREGPKPDLEAMQRLLEQGLGGWFAPPILSTAQPRDRGKLAKALFDLAALWTNAQWDVAGTVHHPPAGRWFKLERRLSKLDWLEDGPGGPAWKLGAPASPAIATFYSFKGGVGRTTLLAACAWQLARNHEKKVGVIDLDLEAPGLGLLLDARADRGVIDFIVDSVATGDGAQLDTLPAQALGAEAGKVDVLPAGKLGSDYLEKLGRLDFGGSGGLQQKKGCPHPSGEALRALLNRFRGKGYDFLLLDARAGLHDLAGLSLHGFAHIDVLIARASEQGYAGLDLTLQTLARRRNPNELSALLVHSMVPADAKEAAAERARFGDRCYDLFNQHIYQQWDDREIPQREAEDALHAPFPITRNAKLESIDSLANVEAELFSPEYTAIVDRLVELCAPENEEEAS